MTDNRSNLAALRSQLVAARVELAQAREADKAEES